jgi:signal transduction histidine kinase
MDVPFTPDATAATAPRSGRTTRSLADVRLTGRALIAGRATWFALVAAVIGLLAAGAPIHVEQLRVLCAAEPCPLSDWQPSPDALRQWAALGVTLDGYATLMVGVHLGFTAVWIAIGALVFWRRSDDPIGLFAAIFLATSGATMANPVLNAAVALHPALRVPSVAVQMIGIICLGAFLYLFPDGRFTPRWTRWAVLGWIIWCVPEYFFPNSVLDADTWPMPLQAAALFWFFGSAVVAQVWRYRRVSDAVQRQQTKWVVVGVTAALIGHLALFPLAYMVVPGAAGPGFFTSIGAIAIRCLVMFIPLSIGVAVLRYRLWEIDILINRALVYGALTASIIAVYAVVVGYLSLLFRAEGNFLISLIAAGLVAVLFHPLRDRLQRGVNRLLYGERDDPYAVLSRLDGRLAGALAPEAVLPTVVETVAQALKLPYAAVALADADGSSIAASVGVPVAEPFRLPLLYQGETVGELRLAPRAPGEGFGPPDRRVLDAIARHAGVAAHAVQLTADLQRSRERLVTAREEERRRLRRDLHDGLGPALGGLSLKLEIAQDLVATNPTAAVALLGQLQKHTQEAIADIRRLVYDLRPPALDELGLVGALRAGAAGYEQGERGPRVTIEAPEPLPPLPAAVEVAAYRIAQEALTNAIRHAGAASCQIRLTLDEAAGGVGVEVVDDGRGLPADGSRRAGVGLTSMRERAAELGGTCAVEPAPGGGTVVRARLPYTQPPAASLATDASGA